MLSLEALDRILRMPADGNPSLHFVLSELALVLGFSVISHGGVLGGLPHSYARLLRASEALLQPLRVRLGARVLLS